MTDPNDFYHKPCEKLSAACVDAFVELVADPTTPSNLGVSSSWGTSYIDMGPIVKASETVTHLTLTDTALQYDNESGEVDCINGDDLSGIISMHLLKDVDQTTTLEVGMAYVWNGTKFVPQTINAATDISSLEDEVAQLETSVSLLQTSNTELTQEVTILQQDVTDLQNRVTALEDKDTGGEATES